MERDGRLVVVDSCASTNTTARDWLAEGRIQPGQALLAREQTGGRTLGGDRWHSPRDAGVYLSLVAEDPPRPVAFWPAIALFDLLDDWGIEADVKWPNDVLVDRKKIAGILVEQVPGAWVIGMGLNLCSSAVSPELCEIATAAEEHVVVLCPGPIDAANALLKQLDSCRTEDLAVLWSSRSSMLGRRLRWTRGEARGECTAVGVRATGELVVRHDDGSEEVWASSSGLDVRIIDDAAAPTTRSRPA